MHIHHIDLSSHALAYKTPIPENNQINNLGRHFLEHNCFILNFSDPWPGVDMKGRRNIVKRREEDSWRNNAFFTTWLIWSRHSTRFPALGVKKIQFWWTLPWTLLLYPQFIWFVPDIAMHLVCLNHAPECRRRF